ncbi:hypothetical protein ElyMa_006116100 [Elysia marginata]|uniref:Uncharacterized protein n=1 Tax=Elysia marginata TaxID=1093978 RepID=A0AAV4GV09_9GAST|nr:hypothetical protein ElyMa_006116100 [Elysia marginata]
MGGIILPHLQFRSNNPTPINAPIIKQSSVQLPQGYTASGISMDSQMENSSPLNNPC